MRSGLHRERWRSGVGLLVLNVRLSESHAVRWRERRAAHVPKHGSVRRAHCAKGENGRLIRREARGREA
eukprot:5359370-Prymnesium_polylepis.1